MPVSVGAKPARAKATPVSRERFVMPAGHGGAWPDNEPTRRATHQRPGATGVEGAGESRGRKRAWLRHPWAAGPDRGARGRQGLAAVPVGGGRAWPGFETTHPATRQRHSAADVEGAVGTGEPGCGARGRRQGLAAVPVGGGRARAGLEIDHSERSSRVAISRAGRRPPAHTAARPHKQRKNAARHSNCAA